MSKSIIGQLMVSLGLDSAQFKKGARDAQSSMQKLGASMQKVGAAISVVGAGVALAVKGQLNAAEQIGRQAQVAGTSAEQFQRFAAGARSVGIEGDKLADILKDMNDRVGDFLSTGGGPMADFFENIAPKVGVTAEQFRGLSGADALQLYVSSLEAANLSQAEMAFYMEALASDATALIPLLQNNGAEMNRLADAAERAGSVISGETIEAAASFNQSLRTLGDVVSGVAVQITAELAPALARVGEFVAEIAVVFSQMDPAFRRFSAILAGLTVVLGPLLVGLGLIVSALGALSAPVLAVIAGIAALTAAVIAFWPEIVALKDALVTAARDGFEYLRRVAEEVVTFFRELPAQMAQIGSDIIDGLVNGITAKWEAAKARVTGVGTAIIDDLKRTFGIQSPSRVMMGIGSDITEGLALGIEQNAARPIGAIQTAAEGMRDVMSRLSGGLANAFTDMATGAKSMGDSLKSLTQDILRMVTNRAFTQLFDMVFAGFGFGGAKGGGINFGGFRAAGGPVSAGRSYVVGERGPEMFVPRVGGQIVPNGSGGGGTVVQVIDQRRGGPDIDTRRERGPDGREIVRIVVGEEIGRGSFDKPMGGRFGNRPQPVRR